MAVMPPEITYGYVADRLVLAVGDGADGDRTPDARPAVGKVKFTPKTKVMPVSAPTPGRVLPQAIEASLDADGYLIDDQGAQGVWLVVGLYDVTYSFTSATVAGHEIEVTAAHTESAPLYLTLAVPPGGPILTPSQYTELNNRLLVVEAGGGGSGAPGADGADGASAYEVAVTNGYVGTEAEWLASLVGPKGDKGDQGIQGIPGVDGADGTDGTDGVGIPQTLSLAGSNLTLSDGGGTVTLPSGGGGGGFAVTQMKAGWWYGGYLNYGQAAGFYDTFTPVVGTLYMVPFLVGETTPIDRLGCRISTAGGVGAVARMGLYESRRLVPYGSSVVEGSASAEQAGIKEITVPTTTLAPGLYWLGWVTNDAAVRTRAMGTTTRAYLFNLGHSTADYANLNNPTWRFNGVPATAPLPAGSALTSPEPGHSTGNSDFIHITVRAA